ncbi:MAG: binding-protein-dependent transport system inner rane component [Acidimicrobiales bacterium]|nr:binding-protein-dependent transport system inner rane component [Acidimicrobiales bacterium]
MGAEGAVVTVALRIGRILLSSAISIAVVLLAWWGFLKFFDVLPFIGKGPGDVWKWLFTDPEAGVHRGLMRHESYTTLRDAFLGLLFGTVAAVACAVVFNLSRTLQQLFMPIAMVLRSVPLVAMTPLIVLIFGRGLTAVTVISGIVTFFPTLVNVALALKATPKESIDLLRAYGASPLSTLLKVQLPSSLPALFASLRIAAPLALVGALLAEWLATGQGLGYSILQASALSDYNGLWSRVALVTMYSVVLYKVIGGVEVLVLRRFSAVAPR